MKFGIKKEKLDKIIQLISSIDEVDQAVIYGSRAKGNPREGSDIDITLFGNKLDTKQLSKLYMDLDDLEFPYLFDLSIYHQIDNEDLKRHIERVGKIIYSKPAPI